jgi:hypothetical protein
MLKLLGHNHRPEVFSINTPDHVLTDSLEIFVAPSSLKAGNSIRVEVGRTRRAATRRIHSDLLRPSLLLPERSIPR